MNAPVLPRLEQTLVLMLVLSFLGPLGVGAYLHISRTNSVGTAWLRNYTLAGAVFEPEKVDASRASLLSGKYQDALAKNFGSTFPARELLIRLIDEIYYRVFRSSPAGVIIGPDSTLCDLEYTKEYDMVRYTQAQMRPMVEDMKRMQDFCAARGQAFAVLITPSKASVYPEKLPQVWRDRYNAGPRAYESLVPLLKEYGVHFTDSHAVMMDYKALVKTPLYPLGGIHWTSEAAFRASNELLSVLSQQGLPVKPNPNYHVAYTDFPQDGRDRDLADFLNCVTRFDYQVPELTPEPMDTGSRYLPNIVFVGGSFVWKMLTVLDASRQFSELDYYYYYTARKNCEVDGEVHEIARPAPPMNFDADIYAADALVVELNEQAMSLPNHITRFLHDALEKLPDPHAPRAAYHYEGQQSYFWGDTLSLIADQHPVKILTSFTTPGPEGTYTNGNLASLRFTVPPATEDMRLEVTAGAFLWGEKVPRQRVEVVINGHPCGDLIWDAGGTYTRQLLIPKEYLAGDKLFLEFHLPDAASPSELNLFPEYRKLGICISKIRFQPTSAFEPNERPLQYQWGRVLSFVSGKDPVLPPVTNGFTLPSERGTYTDGPLASVHFAAPPVKEDMKLLVDAVPFLADEKLRQQRVNVSINSHAIGSWILDSAAGRRHELLIPKGELQSGRVLIDLHLPDAISPADLGLSKERRKLGICVSSFAIYPASGFAPDITPLNYHYGDFISLTAGKHPVGHEAATGFTSPGEAGSYTNGSPVSLQFVAPAAAENMILEVNATPFVDGEKLPAQRVEVLVNATRIGTREWRGGGPTRQELTVPKALLRGGKTVITFELPDAASPASLGIGPEKRQLGICVTGICLYPASGFAPDVHPLSYHYGQTLSFVTGKAPVGPDVTSGFASPGEQGAFTDGTVATLQFLAPPAPADMKLRVVASAFLHEKLLPKQSVDVSVNGRPLGQWTWEDSAASTRELDIPKETLPGGKTVIVFSIAHATSPAELGLNGEQRKLGVCVSSVILYPAAGFPLDDHPLQYKWGQLLSFRSGPQEVASAALSGFTPPGDLGAFTNGNLATVEFAATPAPTDMKLVLRAGAFLHDDRLPEQVVMVAVNSHPVGEWRWTNSAMAKHELTIPKALLIGPRVRLEFTVPHATAPSELGVSTESRKLGICVSDLSLSSVNGFSPDEHPFQYTWGQDISLVAGNHPIDATALTGFTAPGERGAFTDGEVATIEFSAAPEGEDMRLVLHASAFIDPERLPRQSAAVEVNGHPVGEWTWTDSAEVERELVIPKAFLPGPRVRISFHLPQAKAPRELGLYDESRRLGICISKLVLYPASDTSPQEQHLRYRWGDTLSFKAGADCIAGSPATKGFTAPGNNGAFTDGEIATIRFAATAAPGNMRMSLRAGAFLAGERLRAQQVDASVNGHPVATWTWQDGGVTVREANVPQEYLQGSRVLVELHVAHPTSPAELGLFDDARQLGICVESIRFEPVAK